jgi:exosortase C (VPDSG-CTERM-specific)
MPEAAAINGSNTGFPPQVRSFGRGAAVLALLFAVPLFRLAHFAAISDLDSYILLIPPVCVYLAWLEKDHLHGITTPAMRTGLAFFAGGLALTAWHWCAPAPAGADSLAQITTAFVLFVGGLGFMILGGGLMRQLAFSFGLLIFMIPMPDGLRAGIESVLQHGSATAAGWMFAVSDVPVLQDDLTFKLPAITLHVAPECSGIHSTLVLFITSLVAGKFFLKQPWKRAVLCLAVIPLALARNGFRIFVLGELCTHIGPQMIDSPIHHHGGPLFFVLSLVPFLLLLYVLRKYWRPVPGASND